MPIKFPVELITETFASATAGFNICYFKDTRHAPNAPAHYHVSISLKNGVSIVLCIITSQMQKLAKKYEIIEPDAINCLIPLDSTMLPCISKPCVINCNDAMLLTYKEFARIIDPDVGIEVMVPDNKIDNSIKSDIIRVINESPLVQGHIKVALNASYHI